jgi:murein tripeptide amidase MpaA
MHGNESTTTKGLFDFLNCLNGGSELQKLLKSFSFTIPMLNPDGAKLYTRLNANQIDLNRISKPTQPEQSVESVFESFKPTIAITYMTSAPSLREVRLSVTMSF